MILVNAVLDLSVPSCASTDLLFAAVAFNDEKVAGLQAQTVQLAIEEFEVLDLLEVEPAALDIRNAEVRVVVCNCSGA